MRWTVSENECELCPGLQLSDLPDKIPSNMHIIHSNGMYGLLSKNIAGILPCKNGHEIIIAPKYSDIHPIELIAYIHNISGITVDRESFQTGVNALDLQTITSAFIEQLILIRSSSRKFKRISTPTQTSTVVGKVNWLKTYQNQMSGKHTEIETSVRNASYDIPENAIIAAAAQKVSHLYTTNSTEYDILHPWIKLAHQFNHSLHELYEMHLKLNEKSLSGAHAFYYIPVMLSKIILGFNNAERFVSEDNTILFNMPGLYEEYIRTGFQRIGGKYGSSIQKGIVPSSFLFCNGECEMIPDITVYDGNKIKALMDVKYKTPDSKDYYQVYSYMKYSKLNTAYIISPAVTDGQTITAFDGSKIIFIRIDTSDPNALELAAEKIIRSVM